MWRRKQKQCVVAGCKAHSASLHTLPNEPVIKDEWLKFIYDTIPEKCSRSLTVCSTHFTPDCFLNRVQFNQGFAQKLLLKEGAIPTLHGVKGVNNITDHGAGANLQFSAFASPVLIIDQATRNIAKPYIHKQDKEFPGNKNCVCCICGKRFSVLGDLIKHFNTDKHMLLCRFCHTVYNSVALLASHLNDSHSRILLFCPRCCITFNNMCQMNEHMIRHLEKDAVNKTIVDQIEDNGITQNNEAERHCLKEEEKSVTIEKVQRKVEDEPVKENAMCKVRCVKEEEEEVVIKTEMEEVEIHVEEEIEEAAIDNVLEICVKNEQEEIIQNKKVKLNVLKEEEGILSIVKKEEIEVSMVTEEEYDLTQLFGFNNLHHQESSELDWRVHGVLQDHNYVCRQSLDNPIAFLNQHMYNSYRIMESNVKDKRSENVYVFQKETNNLNGQSDLQKITEKGHKVHAILLDHDYTMMPNPVNPIVSEQKHIYNTRSSVKNTNGALQCNDKDNTEHGLSLSAKSLIDHDYLKYNFSEQVPINKESIEEEDNKSLCTDQSSCSPSSSDSDYIPTKDLDSLFCSSRSLSKSNSDDGNSENHSNRKHGKSIVIQRPVAKKDWSNLIKTSMAPVAKSLQICTGCGLSKHSNSENSTKKCTCVLSHKCCLCEGSFATLELLLKHQAEEHPMARYFCLNCLQMFLNQEVFSKHTCTIPTSPSLSLSVNSASPSVPKLESSNPRFNKQESPKCSTVFSCSPKILQNSGSQKFPVQTMTSTSLSHSQNQKVTWLHVNGGQTSATPSSPATHTTGLIPVLIPVQNNAVPKTPMHIIVPKLQSDRVLLPHLSSSQVIGPLFTLAQTGTVLQSHNSKSFPFQKLLLNQTTLKPVTMFANQSQNMCFKMRLRKNWLSKAKFLCHQCGVMSCHPSLSIQHQYKHRGPHLYRCQCGRAFQHRLHLLRHQVQHAEASVYVCANCGRTFHGTRHLSCHRPGTVIRPTTGRKKTRKFCTNVFHCRCGQVFRKPSALLWHMLQTVKVHKSRLKRPSFLTRSCVLTKF